MKGNGRENDKILGGMEGGGRNGEMRKKWREWREGRMDGWRERGN